VFWVSIGGRRLFETQHLLEPHQNPPAPRLLEAGIYLFETLHLLDVLWYLTQKFKA